VHSANMNLERHFECRPPSTGAAHSACNSATFPAHIARSLLCILTLSLTVICLTALSVSRDLTVPASATAGEAATISLGGSGHATFYLIGPGVSSKSEIDLGQPILIPPEHLQYAGEYLAILCSGGCRGASFFVQPAQPARLSFLVHPSRVPVNQPDAISGVAFPFDHFGNLVLAPLVIDFQASGAKESLISRSTPARDGVAWFRTASGKSAGAIHITASLGEISARRVLAQVASEPCNLRIKGERTLKGIVVETEPVRDCAGNPVSDGTVVTFTASGSGETSTVDAPIKGDVASALLADSGPVVISAASGVALGNELRIAGK
jgi:hypothetical protein